MQLEGLAASELEKAGRPFARLNAAARCRPTSSHWHGKPAASDIILLALRTSKAGYSETSLYFSHGELRRRDRVAGAAFFSHVRDRLSVGGVDPSAKWPSCETLRSFSCISLQELGYVVLEASDARSALELLKANPRVELIFTDVVLPGGLNGRQLVDQARKLRPGLKALFTTGYTWNAIVHNGTLDPGVDLIGKPFSVDALAKKVRQILES